MSHRKREERAPDIARTDVDATGGRLSNCDVHCQLSTIADGHGCVLRALQRVLALALAMGMAQAHAGTTPGLYAILAKSALIGSSRIAWRDDHRHSDAIVHLDGMLDQHSQLWLDGDGWPVRYRLEARVQGRDSLVMVIRKSGEIIETVLQNGRSRTQRLPCAEPVDFIDNNAFGTLQALLWRSHGILDAGDTLRVFVPQAERFGRFSVTSAVDRAARGGEQAKTVREIEARLSVGARSVPLTLWLDRDNGHLLRYVQPELHVEALRLRHPLAPP